MLSAENRQYPDPTKLEPVKVTLSDKGFDPAKIENWPVQALVVSTETDTALTLKSVKSAPGKSAARIRAPTRANKPKRA